MIYSVLVPKINVICARTGAARRFRHGGGAWKGGVIHMDRIRKKLAAIVPEYSQFPLIFAVAFNMAVYGGARLIAGDWKHYNIESRLDGLIPFWAPSVAIYLGCYLFWIVNYILIARQGKKEVCQFFVGDFLSRVVCLICYLAFPTTNTRPVPAPEGFWNQVVLMLYRVDAADNLFPSIHCLVSWFCFLGVRGRKDVPAWYRGFSCVMAVLVCISTVTTKQHVILDVAGGIILAEVCFAIGKSPKLWENYERLVNRINSRIFPEGGSA